jgi:uncharacterized membrane protein YeaQ/YmgE (transglycosylase-associated protein family)
MACRRSREQETSMLNVTIWLIAGALVGWMAGLALRVRSSLVVNVIVGMVGATIGGLLLGGATMNLNVFSLSALVSSLVGSCVLVGVVKLLRS